MKKERLEESEACRFFHQIITGLEQIHSLGVAHRDLKPENLLLDALNNIKIVDFGLSNTYKPGEFLKTACGSPSYASPEMISGLRYDPKCADLWSVGIILYAMLVGRLPFEDSNTSQLYRKITEGQFHIPSHVSDHAKALIHSLLQVDPSKRIKMEGVRSSRWFQGLINVDRLCDRPRQLQFLSGQGCEVSTCIKCKSYTSDKETGLLIDEQVLAEMTKLEFPLDYVIKCLKLNKHNHATTTYHLLVEKRTNSDCRPVAFKQRIVEQPEQKARPTHFPPDANRKELSDHSVPSNSSLNFSSLPLHRLRQTPSPGIGLASTTRSSTRANQVVPPPRYATARTPSPGFSIASSSVGPVTVSRRLSPSLNLTVSSLSRHTASTKAKARPVNQPKPMVGFGSTTSRFGPGEPKRVPLPFTVYNQLNSRSSLTREGKYPSTQRPSSSFVPRSFGTLSARASLIGSRMTPNTARARVW